MARDEAYQEAERRIEAARQERETELDLSHLGLTELPEAIASLKNLESLYLDNNNLAYLPTCLGQLSQLQNLSLAANQIAFLPDWSVDVFQLKLPLDKNHRHSSSLEDIAFDQVGFPTLLKYLVLSGNQLKCLPNWIGSLSRLRYLDLSDNDLETIPEILARLSRLEWLSASANKIRMVPNWIGALHSLKQIYLQGNLLESLPDSFGELSNLRNLFLGDDDWGGNPLQELPASIHRLKKLQALWVNECQLVNLPDWLGDLIELQSLSLTSNSLSALPSSLGKLNRLIDVELEHNPLNYELAVIYKEGTASILEYLRARASEEVALNEAKLILVGEGEVGKTCLVGALRGDIWVEDRPTTHGVEIKSVNVIYPNSRKEITLNSWDFGGQRIYRPTHQLFFSSSAIYLVVWKPREGSQQGFVKEWIKLIKHREPDAKILIVATHGGPGQRQPDIDRQELIDLFGSDTILGFFHIDSKPNAETLHCTGIVELREAIASAAANLPGMGRKVPTKWQQIREILETSGQTHIPYNEVVTICEKHGLEGFAAELFVRISHILGYLIHYHYDENLKDIVILKPDWLAKAVSFIFDDKEIRCHSGLVEFNYLSQLWSHPPFKGETGYPKNSIQYC